ncbi:MAG: hypothetical protein ACI9US_002969 [Gammaproteobacteria bacterium]|jgi:hypothetical protein
MAMDDYELGPKVMSSEIDRPGSHLLAADRTPPVQSSNTTKTFTYADKCQLAERIHQQATQILKTSASEVVPLGVELTVFLPEQKLGDILFAQFGINHGPVRHPALFGRELRRARKQ